MNIIVSATMNQNDSSRFLIDYEGPDLSGKSGAAKRINAVLTRAIPELGSLTGISIDFMETREPGGSWGADIMRTFIKERWLLAAMAGISPSEEMTAELFTLARKQLYEDRILPFISSEGNHVINSDRTWMSMLALQGDFNDGRLGVPLETLMEMADSATKGIHPDMVILRRFEHATFNADVSFRQLFIMLESREIMPKDIGPLADLRRDQNRFDVLAKMFDGKIEFAPVNAALEPIASTIQDLELIASRLVAKMPEYDLGRVREVFRETLLSLDSEGLFDEIRAAIQRQDHLREVLSEMGMSAYEVMESFKVTRDEGQIQDIKELYLLGEGRADEGNLPRGARR